jgi:hypothetical protein
MRPEELDPNLLEAQTLKISILRLLNAYQTPCDTHPDDWQFDVYGLALVLGRKQTPESRRALIELFDFVLPDAVWDAIVTAVAEDEDPEAFRSLLKARIGQPICAEARRDQTYVDPMPMVNRDRQITNWLEDDDA